MDSFPPVMMNKEASATCKTDLSKAELFNNYLTRIVTDDNYEDFTPGPHHIFGSTRIEVTEIQYEIKILKENKSRDPDKIPPGLLKKTWKYISKSVTSLFKNKEAVSPPQKMENWICFAYFQRVR